jgi:ubiquinone/menaquinone biosynthesis C-methylase UbiE
LDVVAAEPNPGMCEEFTRVLPHVPLHVAEATALPFQDTSFDAVVVAQALHWFDNEGVSCMCHVPTPY